MVRPEQIVVFTTRSRLDCARDAFVGIQRGVVLLSDAATGREIRSSSGHCALKPLQEDSKLDPEYWPHLEPVQVLVTKLM